MTIFGGTGGRQSRPPVSCTGLLLVSLAAGLAATPARAEAPSIAECEARFAADPQAEASSSCFLDAAGTSKAEAIQHVEALLQLHPGNAWLTFYLGSLLWDEPARSADLYGVAADLMKERGLVYGEVRACSNLYLQLMRQDRKDETAAVVDRAVRLAGPSGDRLALARARILEATYLWNRKEDLPRAYRLLLEARAALVPGDSYRLWRDCLTNLSTLAMDMGRPDEARSLGQEAVELAASNDDSYAEASARYSVLRAVLEEMSILPRPGDREQALGLAQQTLAAAETSGHREIEGKAHGILGLLTSGSESELHFQRCYELTEILKDKSNCRSLQARRLTGDDPQRALGLLDEALDLADDGDSAWDTAFAWRERMRVSWKLGTPQQATAESMTALQAIELLRDLQAPTEGRADIFAVWARHYLWFAGRLLEDVKAGDPAALGVAFTVQERMRARALIDSLAAANAGAAGPQTGFAALEQVRQALAPDEALLSFQIAPWTDMMGDFVGGAWLIVVTREGATVHPLHNPLAERTRLRPAVEIFSGLFTGDGDDGDAAAALYQALLADGLSTLGPEIQRLVVVPDDVLHLLPFAALRSDPAAPPLASRYEVTLTPSATLWLQWRQDAPTAAAASALVLADPAFSPVVAQASLRAASLAGPADLGALPWARQEGKAVLRHLGADSRLLVGEEATEAYLKSGPVPQGILHFATHAWTSDNEPESSYVLLSPGAPGEDGRLHPGEIVKLGLQGRMVVLSACSSASGEILRGEGVMNLARAFFQAGAHTVVATLWPLRDDDGAALFDHFYDHLSQGMSVAAALQAAQQDRIDEGALPAAWAGVIVLGDGGRVPVPGGRRGLPRLAVPLAALALCGLSLVVFLARRRRVSS